jgi:hypothetical protein
MSSENIYNAMQFGCWEQVQKMLTAVETLNKYELEMQHGVSSASHEFNISTTDGNDITYIIVCTS